MAFGPMEPVPPLTLMLLETFLVHHGVGPAKVVLVLEVSTLSTTLSPALDIATSAPTAAALSTAQGESCAISIQSVSRLLRCTRISSFALKVVLYGDLFR